MNTKTVDLTVSILTKDNLRQLKECLDSIYGSSNPLSLEIYVVDNSTSSGTRDMIYNMYKDIKLITLEKEASFANAHNRVLKIAKGENIAVLNDDTVILGGAFKKMIDYLKKNPGIGVIGPKMKAKEGPYQQSAFKFPSISDLFADYFFNKIKPDNRLRAIYQNINLATKPKEVDWLLGACLVMPCKAIEAAGFFDEDFSYFYMEDADLCKRIKDAGYKIRYYPKAEIIHHGAQTVQRRKLFMEKALYRNRLKFFKKHRGYAYYLFSCAILYIATLCNIIFDIGKFLFFRIKMKELLNNINEYVYIINPI